MNAALESFCESTDLSLEEVLDDLTPADVRHLTRNVLGHGPVQHAEVFSAWRRARRLRQEKMQQQQQQQPGIAAAVASSISTSASASSEHTTTTNVPAALPLSAAIPTSAALAWALRARRLRQERQQQQQPAIAVAVVMSSSSSSASSSEHTTTNNTVAVTPPLSASAAVPPSATPPDRVASSSSQASSNNPAQEPGTNNDEQQQQQAWIQLVTTAPQTNTRVYRFRDLLSDVPDNYYVEHSVIMDEIKDVVLERLPISSTNPSTNNIHHNQMLQIMNQNKQELLETMHKSMFSQHAMFMEMAAGSIVCLVLRSKNKKNNKYSNKSNNKMVYFGIILDNQVNILLEGEDEDAEYTRCLAIRPVQWFRRAPMRELPNQTTNRLGSPYVKWMSESCPNPVTDVTDKGVLEIFSSPEFMACSESVCCPHALF